MESIAIGVTGQYIDDIPGLDPIHVFWVNSERGKGSITVICYGSAWTAYFGAMGESTIQQFVADVGVDYLVVKMQSSTLKQGKRHEAYLSKVIMAVKQSLRTGA